MIPLVRRLRFFGIISVVVALPPAPGASYFKLSVKGYLAGEPISTTVDSGLAKYYLENSLSRRAADPEVDRRITDIEQRFKKRPLDWLTLREISAETTPDFATLFFIRQSLSDGRNARLQKAYWQEVNRIDAATRRKSRPLAARSELRK